MCLSSLVFISNQSDLHNSIGGVLSMGYKLRCCLILLGGVKYWYQ